MRQALDAGYRHIDCAALYRNEAGCGKAIRDSGIPREQIFFTSKVPPKGSTYIHVVYTLLYGCPPSLLPNTCPPLRHALTA